MSKSEESNLDFLLFLAQVVISALIWVAFGIGLSNFELKREGLLNTGDFVAPNSFIWIPILIGAMTYSTVILARFLIKAGYYILTVSSPQTEAEG